MLHTTLAAALGLTLAAADADDNDPLPPPPAPLDAGSAPETRVIIDVPPPEPEPEPAADAVAASVRPPAKERWLRAAVSGGFSSWYYDLDAQGGGDQRVQTTSSPALAASGELLMFDWLALDVDAGVSTVKFQINGGPLAVTPDSFDALMAHLALAAELRLCLPADVVVGGRAGFRHASSHVAAQTTIGADGTVQALTVIPGYQLESGFAGARVMWRPTILERDVRIGGVVDVLFPGLYAETPDNPGATSLAYGWQSAMLLQIDVVAGVFVELRVQSTGILVRYEGTGARLAFQGDALTPVQGGNVLNHTGAASVGIGIGL